MKEPKPKRASTFAVSKMNPRNKDKYVFRLFVAGATAHSRQAILRAREACTAELGDDFELEVIDVYQRPDLARAGRILATPTLVRESPLPVRRLIGNFANATSLFVGRDRGRKADVVH